MGRTNIDIDDALVAEAMKATGNKTKRAVVEEGLRQLVKRQRLHEALMGLEGLGWEGELDAMRRSWSRDPE
jgi:Arc/MetJ family transcription regulator